MDDNKDECCPVSSDFIKGFVTKDQCDDKHQNTKYFFVIIVSLVAVFLGLVVLAASISYQASITASKAVEAVQDAFKKANAVQTEFHVHEAAQDERDKAVVTTLTEIRDEIKQLRTEQHTLMQSVLERDDL